MQKGLRIKNLKFFTGQQDEEENNSVPEDKFYRIRNGRINGNVLASKPGYQPIGTELTGGTTYQALNEYENTTAGVVTKSLLAIYNKVLRTYNESTQQFDSVSTTWPNVADVFTDSVEYYNKMYFVNPLTVLPTNPTSQLRLYFNEKTGTPVVGATLLQAVSGATATVISVNLDLAGDLYSFDVNTVVGTFDMANLVTGTNPDASTFTFTPNLYSFNNPGIAKYDGTSLTTVDYSPPGIAIESWAERLWILDPYAPIVRASRAASVSSPANIEDWQNGTIQEMVGKGGKCVAIRVLDNQIYVWKNDGIWTNTIDRLASGKSSFYELSRTGGATNQKSTIRVENDVWFVTPSLEVRSLGTEQNFTTNSSPRTRNLTEIIKRSMQLLDPVQDDATMTYNNRIVKVHLRTKNSPTNNFTIVYDYDTEGFEIDWGQAVHIATKFKNEIYYGQAGVSGQLYKDEIGYTAGGLAYSHQADTPFMDDNRPDTSKWARYLYWRGKLSYNQSVTLRLYRGGDYTTYSTYVIPAPADDGVTQVAPSAGGQWGQAQQGADLWGGGGDSGSDIPMYQREKLISISRRSNMYAVGIDAQINGGKVITEQLIVKLIDDNENYKRANQ